MRVKVSDSYLFSPQGLAAAVVRSERKESVLERQQEDETDFSIFEIPPKKSTISHVDCCLL
jgi:hypothetical protein